MKLSDERKALNIRFEILTTANDLNFKTELIELMAASIRELKPKARHSLSSGNREIFHQAAHKAKSTITLINDPGLSASVEGVKDLFRNPASYMRSADEIVFGFEQVCDQILERLEDAKKALEETIPSETKA